MAAELNIQSVEGLAKAFDKLQKSVGGVKYSLGTMKGSSVLAELQKAVAGVDKLEAALQAIDKGIGNSLNKIVGRLDNLPRAIADALGSGAKIAQAAGKKIGDATAKGLEDGYDKVKEVQIKADATFRSATEKFYNIRQEAQLKADGAFRAAVDRHQALVLASELGAYEKQLKVDAAFRVAQEAELARSEAAKLAMATRGQQAVQTILKAAAAERNALNERQLAVDAKFREAEQAAIAKSEADKLAMLAKGQVAVQSILKAAEAAKLANMKAEQTANERQLAVDAKFRSAQLAAANKAAQEQAAQTERWAVALNNIRKAAYTQEQLQAKEAAAKLAGIQASSAKAMVGQATSSPAGSYSVFAPSSRDHGSLKVFNDELAKTPKHAAAAGKGLQSLGVDANTTHSAMRGLASGFGLLWLTWGSLLPLLSGAAISNGFVQTIKLGLEVQGTFEVIRVLSEETAQSVLRLQTQMVELAKNGPFGLTEIAAAMKTLSLAGLDAAKVGSSIRDVLNFAVAGDTTLKASADTLSSVATAFKYTADQYGTVADVIAKTAAVSKSSVENMSEAFKTASVINSQYGASLQDVGLGLAALANLGITGSAAGTALRNMYADLSGRSKQVAKILKDLKADFRDVDTGKFPDLITMIQRFETAVNKAGTEVQKQDLINKLLSERGAKPVIELLQLMRTEAEKTGKSVSNQLVELQQKIAQNAGFVAVSAAELSTTASNQIKATWAALQAAAFEAYTAVEPSIFKVTAALRNAFESKEFKQGISGIIEGVGSLIVGFTKLAGIIATHIEDVKTLVLTYAAFKVIGAAGGGLSVLSANLAATSAAMTAAGGATELLKARLLAMPASAAGAATGLAGTAAAASGLFAILGRGLALLGPIAAAITLAAGAWQLYKMYSDQAADSAGRHTGKQSDELIAALDREIQALRDKNAAIREGMTLDAYLKKKEVVEVKDQGQKAIAEATDKVTKAQKAYDDQLMVSKAAANDMYNAQAIALSRKQAELTASKKALAAVKAETAANDAAVESKKKELLALAQDTALLESQNRAIQANKDVVQERGKLTGEYDPMAAAKVAADAANKELQELERRYGIELSMTKDAGDRSLRMLEDEHKNKLISEGTYLARFLELTEKAEADQLEVATRYRTLEENAAKTQRDRLVAKLGNGPKAGVTLRNFDENLATQGLSAGKDFSKIQETSLERQAKAANASAGALIELQTKFNDFWAKDQARLSEESSIKKLSQDFDGATAAQKVYNEASKGASKAYLPEIEATSVALAKANKTLGELQEHFKDADLTLLSDQQVALLSNAGEQVDMLGKHLDDVKAKAEEVASSAGLRAIVDTFLNKPLGENLAKGFDAASKAVAGLVNSMKALAAVQVESSAASKAAEESYVRAVLQGMDVTEARAKLTKDQKAISEKSAQAEVRAFGNIASAAKTFFKEGSKGYKTLETAEKVFRTFELAMSLKSIAQRAVEWASKLTLGATGEAAATAQTAAGESARNTLKIPGVFLSFMSQLGPWGVAAATAAIAALGLTIAGSRSSGSVTPANDGTGTVLGDKTAKSESITKSIDKLSQNSDIALKYSQGMLAALKNIEANIGGLTNLVVRSTDGNLTTGSNLATPSKSLPNYITNPLISGVIGGVAGLGLTLASKIPVLDKLVSALFGAKTSVTGTGLSLPNQSLGQAISSSQLQQYVDTYTTKKFFGITYSKSSGTTYAPADQQLADQFTKIFKSFYDSVKLAAEPLGVNLNEVSARLNSFVLSIGKIDLQGLTGTQIQEKLTAVLGAAADSIAQAAIPGMEDFQKVGEGYFETIVRVASGVEQAQYALSKLGLTMVDYTKIINKQGDVALEVIRESILKAEALSTVTTISKIPKLLTNPKAQSAPFDEFYNLVTTTTSVLSGVGKIIQTFSGTADELVDLYTALVGVKEAFASIGKAGVDFGIDMITAAGGLDALQSGLKSYYDNFLTDQERITDMTRRLTTQFAAAGVTMPTSIQGFKDLIKGLDLTSDANQVTFGKLIVLSDAFYQLQQAMGDTTTAINAAAQQRKDLEEQLVKAQEAYNAATMTSAELLALQRAGIDASNLALFDQIQNLNAATEAAKKAATERKTLQDQLDDLTMSEADKLAAQRAALESSNQALFDAVQAAKAVKAAEDALAASRKAVADEITSLRNQYDDLTLTDAQKVAKERNALLSDEAKQIFDNIQAVKAAQAAEEALAAARQASADELQSLRNQLDDLTLTDAQKAAKERNALLSDEARAIFDSIQATKAAQAAEEALANTRKAIADEITSLQNQYDDLTMTEAQKAAKERASLLSDEAKQIFDNIQAYKANQAAQEAQQAANEAAAQAAKEAAAEAERLRNAWMDAAKGIKEEIDRIRGVSGTPQQSLSRSQAAFAIALAQTRAGSLDAANSLPKLSQDLLQVAKDSSSTSLEFATIQASTLASLDQVLRMINGGAAPSYAGPEMAMGGAYNTTNTPAGQSTAPSYSEMAAELRELKTLVTQLLQQNAAIGGAIATSTAKTAKILSDVTPGGDSIQTTEVPA